MGRSIARRDTCPAPTNSSIHPIPRCAHMSVRAREQSLNRRCIGPQLPRSFDPSHTRLNISVVTAWVRQCRRNEQDGDHTATSHIAAHGGGREFSRSSPLLSQAFKSTTGHRNKPRISPQQVPNVPPFPLPPAPEHLATPSFLPFDTLSQILDWQVLPTHLVACVCLSIHSVTHPAVSLPSCVTACLKFGRPLPALSRLFLDPEASTTPSCLHRRGSDTEDQ